jgi:methylenetetrahydrofolate reductase (NADPH)
MQLIRDIIRAKSLARKPVLSLEFFPPKTSGGDETLLNETIPALLAHKPDFCSVTYGAGGGTREKTLEIVDRIQRQHQITAMSHLTCVGSTAEQLLDVVNEARSRGIVNILALRGDPPGGTGEYPHTPGGFDYSYQLVDFLRKLGGLCIGAAGFPEGHIACKEGREIDWDRLKHKIDHGVDFIITQLFFDNDDYFRFRDGMIRRGVTIPLFPGIINFLSASQIQRFTMLCGASIPPALKKNLEKYADDDAACADFGVDYA